MHAFFDKLRPFIRWVARHPLPVVGIALLLTLLGALEARHLSIDPDFANLLPHDYASVQAIEKLRATVGGESDAAVAIESPSFAANRAFAEAFIPQALALRPAPGAEPFFRRVDYRRETAFLENNALYFATDRELDELEAYLEGLREEARLEANPFYFDLEDDFADEDSAAAPPDEGAALQDAYNRIVGQEYPISADSTILVLRFYPSGSQTNTRNVRAAFDSLDALIARTNPASFQPDMQVTTAGRLYRQLVEVQSIQNDVAGSFGVGALCVLLSVVLYFLYKAYHARARGGFNARILFTTLARAPFLALLIGLPLLMSLAWTGGVAYLAYGALNLMTATLGLVLFGLGIDYGIHFYARYTEERTRGHGVVDAIDRTFASTAQAITIGALSTAGALYSIVFADFKGFSEFGAIAGTGVLLALVAMIVVLPAFLSLFERWRLLDLENDEAFEPHGKLIGRAYPAFRPIVVVSFVAVVAALVFLPRVRFEYDFSRLEPTYEAYNDRNEAVRQVYSESRRNPAYIVTDTPEEIPAIVAAYEARQAGDSTSLIADVESLQQRFPLTPADQQARLARIAHIRTLLADEFLSAEPNADLEKLRRAASTTEALRLDEVPESIRKQYTTKSGELGNFVIVYPDPDSSLSDGRRSIRFAEQVGAITTAEGQTYHAGSTSLVAADMLRLMMREAPYAIGATLVVVLVLMWLTFRTLKWTLLGLLPLFVGVLWMVLGMEIFDLRLNFYNLVVLPAVLGIGMDAGVHIVHRYREEGPGSLRYILRSTGEHVFMSSLTTMIGFGGLLLSFHPGLRSIGELAVLGIGTTLTAALVFLPALLQWIEWRDARRAQP